MWILLHGINVRQTEIHTADPLIAKPSFLEVKIIIAKLEKHKLPHTD
jgi:hypothetical protein